MSGRDTDYQRLLALANELQARWRLWQAFYLDAAAGFHLIRKAADEEREFILGLGASDELNPADFVDDVAWGYQRIFDEPFCTSGIHTATIADVRRRNAPHGSNFVELGNLLLISLFTYWNEYFRREYVMALGKLERDQSDSVVIQQALRDHGSVDLWGDISLIRNDIVHCQAVSTRRNAARCRLIKWFPEHARIALEPPQVRALLLGVLKFHNDVYAQSFAPAPPIIIGKRG